MLLTVLVLCLRSQTGNGYSTGAPDEACNTLLPGHGFDPQTVESDSPFNFTTSQTSYSPGDKITGKTQSVDCHKNHHKQKHQSVDSISKTVDETLK